MYGRQYVERCQSRYYAGDVLPEARRVSSARKRPPHNQTPPASSIIATTTMNAMSQCSPLPTIAPRIGGDAASPSAWIRKMFMAKAVARVVEGVTFARIVLLGPVLKKRKKTATPIALHAYGKGSRS